MSATELVLSEKYFGMGLFTILVLTGVLIGFIISGIGTSDSTSAILVSVYVTLIAVGWFSFSPGKGIDGASNAIYAAVVGGPVILLAMTLSAYAFWPTLIIFVALGIQSSFEAVRPNTTWDKIFVALPTSWAIIGFIVTLGRMPFLPYANSEAYLAEIAVFLNIRVIVTIALISLLVAKAMLDAYRGARIKVPALQDLRFEIPKDDNSLFTLVLVPITVILNGILTVLQKLTMAIWSVIYYVGVFLYRTGVNLADQVRDIVLNSALWRATGRVIATFAMLLVFGLVLSAAAPSIVEYVRNDTSIFAVSISMALALIACLFLFSLTTCIITASYWLWRLTEEPLPKAALGGAMVLIGMMMSSICLWILAKLGPFSIPGYESLGVYTLLMAMFVLAVFLFQIARRAGVKAPKTA